MIWIDITDLMAWSGHMTGIMRVVYNIASRYQSDGEVRFFRYDAIARKFYAVDMHLEEWLNGLSNDNVVAERRDVKELVKRYIPIRARKNTPPIVKKVIKKSVRYALQKKTAMSWRARSQTTAEPQVVFAEHDIVMVLGNAWNEPFLFQDLGKKKQQERFKLVNVVYDLIPVLQPQFFGNLLVNQYTEYMFEAAANCDLVLPISKSTERDLAVFCKDVGLKMPPSKVIRLGDEINAVAASKPSAWYRGSPFIICVGTIEVRKNHALLYYAYKQLFETMPVDEIPDLVIIGSKGWYTADVSMLFEQDPQVSKKVRILHKTTDEELAWLYEECAFTVYPSMYEGWGLPVAESLAHGKVTLSSNASSMPEVGGTSADYFSPYDALGCAELIKKYANKSIALKRQSEILSSYKITTWDTTYNQVARAVKDLLS